MRANEAVRILKGGLIKENEESLCSNLQLQYKNHFLTGISIMFIQKES